MKRAPKTDFRASNTVKAAMNRNSQIINERYDALMFARSPESARKAARELVKVVLGEEALERPLEETLRECCRRLRPSDDPKEQARFESEFVELGIWPNTAQKIAA
jgi:hypothetical protein